MAIVEAVDRLEDFARLEAEWTELVGASRADGVFMTWPWLQAWWRHLGGDRKLWVLTVRAHGQLTGALPLAITHEGRSAWPSLPTAEFLGSGAAGADYLDVIARPDQEGEVIDALAAFLSRRRGLVVRLHGVVGSGSLAASLAQRLATEGWSCVETAADVCPNLSLAGRSWPEVLRDVGMERNVRRRRRNLAKGRDVAFVEAREDAERREALDLLVRLHDARWRTRGGSTAFHTAALVQFHHDVSRRFLDRGWLRLGQLRVEGRTVALIYGFAYGGKFYFYQSGFDDGFARFSVGAVALSYSIERAVGEGLREYDMLHGDEDYKSRWTSQSRDLLRLELYPPGARAKLQRQALAARRGLGRLVRPALAPLWRRRYA